MIRVGKRMWGYEEAAHVGGMVLFTYIANCVINQFAYWKGRPMDHALVRQNLENGLHILSLSHNGKSVIADLARKKEFQKAKAVEKAAIRIADRGTRWGLESETLVRLNGLDASLVVCELKIKTTTVRVMTYLHDDEAQTPVLLFYFEAHQIQAHGGIPDDTMRKARRLAGIARDLMRDEEREDCNDYRGRGN